MREAIPNNSIYEFLNPRVRLPSSHVLRGEFFSLPNDVTILTLFERQAQRVPDHRAVVFGHQALSFAQLNADANCLAVAIRKFHVSRGDLVPIVCKSGFELLIAMLAVMKAGAAFVPVDLEWPTPRLNGVIRKLCPKVVLVDGSAVGAIDAVESHLLIESYRASGPEVSVSRLPDFQEDIIYGFFTSGSTGDPKCCLNIHRGLLNRFIYMNRFFLCKKDDVILQNSKQIFDSSIWQLLWPLTNGNTVVIPQREGLLDIDETIDIIHQHKVTMTDFVPSIFNILVTMLEASPERVGKISSLRQLLIGGEEINSKAVQSFRALLPHVGITNTYGPTEASIGMVFHEITDNDGQAIPLGRPIANTFALIADDDLMPLSRGEVGEVVIGGECLGSGYLNDPVQTANSFPPNPFVEVPGIRVYRTGDLGCIDDSGNLLFKGRKDFQVKVDGVRAELGEIESALLACDGIRDAKVVAKTGPDGRNHLVGFVVASVPGDAAKLRLELRGVLPAPLVPHRIFFLDSMPLTANGKVDRRQLLKRLETPVRDAAQGQMPSGADASDAVAAVLREVLGVDDIDETSNFFELGGDSLQAISLSLELEKLFDHEVSTHDIYRHPTVGELADFVENKPARSKDGRRREDEPALPFQDIELADALPDSAEHIGAAGRTPRNILLTGATGFIGAHLLAEILALTEARIYCLVRASDGMSGIARLRDALNRYGLPDNGLTNRLVAVRGNLAEPKLGLADRQHADLAQTVDTVVHNGAVVDFLKSYRSLRNANVLGTLEALKLARSGAPKQFHHVSSLSIFSSQALANSRELIEERIEPPLGFLPDDSYSQSKWAAEHLVARARSTGSTVHIYRLGEIMPSTRTGIGNPKSLLLLLIKTSVLLKQYPNIHMTFDYTPVDFACRLLAEGIKNRRSSSQNYHLFNPHAFSFTQLMACLAAGGMKLERVPYARFRQSIKAACTGPNPNPDFLALFSILSNASELVGNPVDKTATPLGRFSSPNRAFSCANCASLAQNAAIEWPKVSANLLEPFADRMLKQIASEQ